MICVTVFEPDGMKRREMHELLTGYSIRRDTELQTYWFTDPRDMTRFSELTAVTGIALIATAWPDAPRLGRKIYGANPDCRIVYYGPADVRLERFLRARPVGYHRLADGGGALEKELDAVLRELTLSTTVFRWSTRRRTVLIPVRRIVYLQSDLKNVTLRLTGGGEEHITAKLSELESRLPSCFIRIHQSFLVNIYHIRALDKSVRTVTVTGGDTLPVSDARYGRVEARLDAAT